MNRLAALADDPALGGKARSLARLAAAGLPVPPGFVVTDALFAAWAGRPLPSDAAARLAEAPLPAGYAAELETALTRLGAARVAVRSSFATEDDPEALAPGVYESVLDVEPTVDAVTAALRVVLGSALAPAARAYAAAHARPVAEPPVAVLVHAYVGGRVAGHAVAATPDAPAEIWTPAGRITESDFAARAVAAGVRTMAARFGPSEVEWVLGDHGQVFLQWRPFRQPPEQQVANRPAPEPGWRWDAAHNPFPLSPAQAGLVAAVDESCRIGYRQRVRDGYLFYAAAPERAPIPSPDPAAALATLANAVDAAVRALPDPPPLEPALALYLRAYEPLLGAVAAGLRRAREALRDYLRDHGLDPDAELPALLTGVASHASRRRDLAAAAHDEAGRARYLAAYGHEAPAWDVAVPTYAESGTLPRPPATRARNDEVAAAAAATRVRDLLPAATRARFDIVLAAARAAVAAGEDDDALFARLQALVRRALLALGEQWTATHQLAQPDDVFWLTLPLVRARAAGDPTALALLLRPLVGAARAADAAARAHPPGPAAAPGALGLQGTPAGRPARAVGLARVWTGEPPRTASTADEVLVAVSLLPTELPLVAAAALVTETGGPLDHVAAQARERGLPAVVGVAGATRALRTGDLVLVDAGAGRVSVLRRA